MTLAEKNLRSLRIIHFAYLFSAIACLAVPLIVQQISTQPPSFAMIIAFGVVGLSVWAGGIFFRARFVQPASESLRENPDDNAAAGRWRTGVIVSLSFCENLVLFGLVLRFSGASWNVCGVFYAVGIFFLLSWRPRLELPPS